MSVIYSWIREHTHTLRNACIEIHRCRIEYFGGTVKVGLAQTVVRNTLQWLYVYKLIAYAAIGVTGTIYGSYRSEIYSICRTIDYKL